MARYAVLLLIVFITVQLVTSARIIRDAPPPPADNSTMMTASPLDPNALLEKIKGLFSPEGLMQIQDQLSTLAASLQATAKQLHEAIQAKVKQLHPSR